MTELNDKDVEWCLKEPLENHGRFLGCLVPGGWEKWALKLREVAVAFRDERDKLLAAIKEHHDQKADDRCVDDDTKLYAAAGLGPADHRVGDKFAMLLNCARFVDRRCEGGGPWKSYAQLETEREALRVACLHLLEHAPRPSWASPKWGLAVAEALKALGEDRFKAT